MNEDLNLNTHLYAQDGDIVLTHLKGDAPKPIELSAYSASGNLEAPSKFYQKNKHLIQEMDSLVQVDQKANKITLIIGYNHPHKRVITGSLLLDPEFESLGINTQKTYNRTDLAQKLKFLRRYFPDPSVCMDLVDRFKKLEVQFTNRIEQMDNGRGDKRELLDQVIQENSIPESFDLCMPMTLGGKLISFTVDIGIDVINAKHVQFWLESVQVKDLLHDQALQMLTSSVQAFEEDSNLPVLFQ